MMEWNQGRQQLSGSSLLSSIGKAAGSPRLPELLKSKKNLLIYKKNPPQQILQNVLFFSLGFLCVFWEAESSRGIWLWLVLLPL